MNFILWPSDVSNGRSKQDNFILTRANCDNSVMLQLACFKAQSLLVFLKSCGTNNYYLSAFISSHMYELIGADQNKCGIW